MMDMEPEDDFEDIPDPLAEALAPIAEQIQRLQEQLAEVIQENRQLMQMVMHSITAPRHIVRDQRGQVVGVKVATN